ncbi:hypothetical protein HOLleu_06878 [Holothuria leucospilota]|uniref:Endonuclease/exonuclease/phosphatase domain-containing protein n=1 Tax=Holothuria leucospilota TaxID=206669 RepID=A0A9Q1CMR8_HOLLE|nr:hypothetical protein HOLleu_06878 [Holothuria leucospilota]
MTMTVAPPYSRSELLNFRSTKPKLSSHVYRKLKHLGICTVRPTKRGCLAGKNKVLRSLTFNNERRRGEFGTNIPINDFAKLCLVNTRSVRNKCSAFVDFVLDNDFDIVAITETWLKHGDDVIIGDITPAGYTFKHVTRPTKFGGGVGILFRTSLSVKIKDVEPYVSFESMHVRLTSNSRSQDIVLIYRPEIKDKCGRKIPFSVFLQEFSTLIESYQLNSTEVVFMGDFNIWVDDVNNREGKQFMELLSSYGLIQHITEATHDHGHVLDLFITREANNMVSETCVQAGLSDHLAVTCKLMLQKPPRQWKTLATRNLNSIDLNVFGHDIIQKLSSTDFDNDNLD